MSNEEDRRSRSPDNRRGNSRSNGRFPINVDRNDNKKEEFFSERGGYSFRERSRSHGRSFGRHGRRDLSFERADTQRLRDDETNSGQLNEERGHKDIHMVQRDNRGVDVLAIADEDASFILGAGGRTKRKLSRVCGAELNIKEQDGHTILEIRGAVECRERAKLYVDFVMQQRVGPVQLKFDPATRTDLTCIKVPHECVGYVTGRKGQGLRSIEEEWGTLMFFTDLRSKNTGQPENLAIFGPDIRKRRGAELKVMSAVEQKIPGHYTADITENICDNEDFATDHVPIAEADYSYALGKEGATRKKLARASGAVLEYVGRLAFIAGTKIERTRAREYLQWLCAQRTQYVHVVDAGRTDCTVVQVPTSCVAYVTGSKGSSLRRVEEISGTFIFLDGTSRGTEEERLLIFGCDANGRHHAQNLVLERIDEKLSGRSRPPYNNHYNRSRSPIRQHIRSGYSGNNGAWRGHQSGNHYSDHSPGYSPVNNSSPSYSRYSNSNYNSSRGNHNGYRDNRGPSGGYDYKNSASMRSNYYHKQDHRKYSGRDYRPIDEERGNRYNDQSIDDYSHKDAVQHRDSDVRRRQRSY